MLSGGLLFSSLLGAFLLVVAGRASLVGRANERLRREVRQRRRAEETLRASRAQLLHTQFSVDRAVDAIFWVEPDGRFAYVNDAACKMTGYRREHLLELSIFEIDATHGRDEWPEFWESVKTSEELVLETEVRRYDDTLLPVEVAVNYLEADGVGRCFASVRGIAERRRAEEERLRLGTKLQQAQKLESLGVLAGGIAHDFNNLLVGVLGNANLALARLATSDPAREYVRDIESSAEQAAELANQLLAYSGKGKFVVETVDLSKVIDQIVQMIEVSVSKMVEIRYRLGRELPALEADVTQLRQVILNLVTNASEAIGDRGGVVAVKTGSVECDADYLAKLGTEQLSPGTYVFVEVADTGAGMDEETRRRIFEPFFTTKFTGRGLGLAAVLGIVRGHRGALDVDSEPGRGTRVRVLLPASDKAVAERPESEARQPSWSGDGLILLVDDEEIVRRVVRRALMELGFEVLTAADGIEALRIYRQRADEIALVLLDLTMPRMGGAETFTELRRINPEVKVVLTSGYSERDTASRFGEFGLVAFLHKPFRPAELQQMIRSTLEG